MLKQAITATVLSLSLGLSSAFAADMGAKDETIKLTINEWTGQHISAHIAGEVLKKAGYNVEYVTAGYDAQFTAMADGELHGARHVDAAFCRPVPFQP